MLAIFLSFAAVWVCDGYYPVGWGWKGASLHVAFWLMPLSVVVGSVLSYRVTRPRTAATLLLIGTFPFVVGVIWVEIQSTFSGPPEDQPSWLHLRLLAAVLAIFADLILIRRTQADRRRASLVVVP